MPTIVYLDTLPAQNGLDILHSQSKVEILKINSSDNEEKCMSILQKADAYQVGAARDEVPKYLSMLLILNIKNKLFLGDSGIYLLSAVLSFSLLYEYNVNKNFVRADDIFILLMLPGFDLVRLSLTRILNGKNAFVGDRNHIHHLLNKKFSLLKTNLILIIMFSVPILFKNLIMLNNLNTIFLFLLIYCILINLIQRK